MCDRTLQDENLQNTCDELQTENDRLKQALRDCITKDGSNCLAYGSNTPALRRRIVAINLVALEALGVDL